MTTQGHRRSAPRLLGRRRPQFDGLEGRLVLSGLGVSGFEEMGSDISALVGDGGSTSGSSLTVSSTTPGSGAFDSRGLASFTITFDRPVDPISIGFDDFRLVREGEPFGSSVALTASLDASDPTNRRIVLTLGETLSAGRYQLVLSGWSFLTGADGASLGWGGDQTLGTYQVVESGPDLSGAIDLGTPTSTPTVRPGHLELSAGPDGSDLYRITLPEGRTWKLQLEVTAQRDGGNLDAVLTLRDASGNPIATANWGGTDSPLDPRLTAALGGGTYYITVSGSATDSPEDGSYRIHIAAESIEESISVTGVELDRSNSRYPGPTGLTLHFSSAVDIYALQRDRSNAVTLVDESGRSWPVDAVRVSPDHTAVSFVFLSELPAGRYRIAIGGESALVSLAGRAPVAPGQDPGVLGTISIEDRARVDPSELGVLWPSVGSRIEAAFTLAPGASASRTFTMLDKGYPSISIDGGDAGTFRIAFIDSTGATVAEILQDGSDASSDVERRLFAFPAGDYTIVVTNLGSDPLDITLALQSRTTSSASFLETGVGQGPATGTRVLGPNLPPANAPGSLVTPPAIDINSNSAVGPVGPGGVVVAAASAPAESRAYSSPGELSGSVILVEGLPAGRPSSSFEMISVVGPTVGTGTLALSSNQAGLPNGLLVVPESDLTTTSRPTRAVRDGGAAGQPAAEGATREPFSTRSPADARDELSLVEAGWFDRAIEWVAAQIRGEEVPNLEPDASPIVAEVPAETPEGSPPAEARIELASLTTPTVLIVSGLMAYRLRAKAGRGAHPSGGSRHRFDPKCRHGARA